MSSRAPPNVCQLGKKLRELSFGGAPGVNLALPHLALGSNAVAASAPSHFRISLITLTGVCGTPVVRAHPGSMLRSFIELEIAPWGRLPPFLIAPVSWNRVLN